MPWPSAAPLPQLRGRRSLRGRGTVAGDEWVLAQGPRTLSGRAPRAPAGPANRRPAGRRRAKRRWRTRAPGGRVRSRPGPPSRLPAPPTPPCSRRGRRSPREGRARGAAGARNGPAAGSAERERREPERAGRRGRACARRAWVGVRRAGAAGARGRGTPATLDSASPDAGAAAPRIMVSGGSAPPPASFFSFFLSATDAPGGKGPRKRRRGSCGFYRWNPSLSAGRAGPRGPGERAVNVWAGGGGGAAGLGLLVRVRGPDRPLEAPAVSSPLLHVRGRLEPGCPPNRPLLPRRPFSRVPPPPPAPGAGNGAPLARDRPRRGKFRLWGANG